jgi:hypothetical protein
MRILFLDIEISPSLATVWGLFNQNIGLHAVTGDSEVLTWAAAWDGDEYVLHDGLHLSTKREMIEAIHRLLDEADVVVTYNGDRFDLKILNKEFLELGLAPPAPYISIDLYKTVKKYFRFLSNKMDYVCRRLGIPGKVKHRGHQMWLDCMAGKKSAFREMSAYNIHDVVMLEQLFGWLRPWITKLNYSVFNQQLCCPRCGSGLYQSRGPRYSTTRGMYHRYQCKKCKGWFRGNRAVKQTVKFIPI